MALSGRSTLTVLMADRFSLSMSRLYSRALKDREKGREVTICRPHQCPVTEKDHSLVASMRAQEGEKTGWLFLALWFPLSGKAVQEK